ISTVFEVKPDGSEDPVDEETATIRNTERPVSALIQISKSARNLLHTHRLLYAYVVGIYNYKARIYRFDHAAAVVSKEIDLKADPGPLYDFLWRFCHYAHGNQAASIPLPAVNPPPAGNPRSVANLPDAGNTPSVVHPTPIVNNPPAVNPPAATPPPAAPATTQPVDATEHRQTRSMTKAARRGCFLGMDPTVAIASKADCDKVDERLKESDPPQQPLTKEERNACRWVSIVTEHDADGSAKKVKRYILYRIRFLNPRLFSRATTVRDAYDGETWERRTIKDAWRQLARDREDVFYTRLREKLRGRIDLEELVEKYKNIGLARGHTPASDGDDSRSDAPPPSTTVGDESEHELNDEGDPVLADELPAVNDGPLYGLPDVEVGDDL
ncbi:hypothetical protein FOMPIDRAFT_1052246, partial [Fomitopsis schrenkii]